MKVTVWLTHSDIRLVALQILVEFLSALTLIFLNNNPLSEAVHLSNKKSTASALLLVFSMTQGFSHC
jgi:hypothetical protein